MGDANPIHTLGDYSKPSHEGYRNTIEILEGNNTVPLRSDTIRLVQNGCSFHGLWPEDPNQHLKDFLNLMDLLDLDVANRERTHARLSKFEANFKQQQSEMTNKIDTVLKAITDRKAIALPNDTMSRDVLTVGSTMRIPLLYRGEYSQWVERFMNYLEEQTDGEAMINSIKNGDQPLPRVTQVSIAGTSSTEQLPLKDKSMWHMFGFEYGEQDMKAAVLYEYETFKTTEGELLLDTYIRYLQVINDLKKCGYSKDNYVNDSMGLKKKTVVVTSDPLALIGEKTKVSKRKEKVVVSSDSERSDEDDFSELKKITALVKCYNCKKDGHFAKDCKKAKVKDYNYYKIKMLLAKKDSNEQVLLDEDQAWMESKASSSSADEKISEVSYYLSESESESEYETSEYYDNTTTYEQTDGEAMINSIKNGDQPLPHVTQVSIAGTTSTEQPPLKDKSMWSDQEKRIQKIDRLARPLLIQGLPNDIYSLSNSNKTAKDLWDALSRHMLGSEYVEQDRKAAVLYESETLKATEGELLLDTYIRYLQVINDLKKCGYSKDNYSEGSEADDFSELKKITALLEKAFNRRKFYSKLTNNNLRTSSTSQSAKKKQEFVKNDNKKVEKKDDEKKRDISRVRCYNCKKEGHFAKDCKKAKVKDYEYYKTKMLLAKKDKDEQVLLAEDQAWMESSSKSDQEINANMVFMAQIEKVLSDSEAR
nr:retrovirus-related Pol polyprotein from transposon TNT 1-94 [Tanacetum cinerariifolium]